MITNQELYDRVSPVFQTHDSIPWLRDSTVFCTLYGSRAYGLNTETSDYDFKAFCIPPIEYWLGFSKSFEQAETHVPLDCSNFGIQKFFNLASLGNPSILEILFTDPDCHVIVHPVVRKILENRDRFLSTKVRWSFSGYARSQLNRILSHRVWLQNPPKAPPTRAEFNLPAAMPMTKNYTDEIIAEIDKRTDGWAPDLSGFDKAQIEYLKTKINYLIADMVGNKDKQFEAAARSMSLPEETIEIIRNEKKFRQAKEHYNQYLSWKENRNPERAAMEARFGYDGKHASHVIRLFLMCEEILTKGVVSVKRPDRDFILSIRKGAWTYEQLIEWADSMDGKMDELYRTSKLPKTPDKAYLDNLLISTVREFLQV